MAKTFNDWLLENQDELEELIRNDVGEALHQAYVAGMNSMGEFISESVNGQSKTGEKNK